MLRVACLAALLLACACVDRATCGKPTSYVPCAGQVAEPGSPPGTPPTITKLLMPSCAFVAEPEVTGELAASDADGDLALIKTAFYVGGGGPRANENDIPISGGAIDLELELIAQMPSVGLSTVQIKVTDKAGGQSVPWCGEFTLLRQ